jgi:hypothetical protein
MMSQAASPPDFPVPPLRAGNYSAKVVAGPRGPVAVYRFAFDGRGGRRLLVLKLDHYGDFLIGLPARPIIDGLTRSRLCRRFCQKAIVARVYLSNTVPTQHCRDSEQTARWFSASDLAEIVNGTVRARSCIIAAAISSRVDLALQVCNYL